MGGPDVGYSFFVCFFFNGKTNLLGTLFFVYIRKELFPLISKN